MVQRKRPKIRSRNWQAVEAHLRPGAGPHKDKKKEAERKVCRKKVEND